MPYWEFPDDELQTFSVGSVSSMRDEEDEDYEAPVKKVPFGFRAPEPESDVNETDKPVERKRRRKVHNDKRIRQKGRNRSNGSGHSGPGTGKIS